MARPGLSWRNAQLPPNTTVFAIGDIHAHHILLKPMLKAIETKLDRLPPTTTGQVVFIGDYIDRGTSAPETIEMLLDFEQRMRARQNVTVTFLCGNHEECMKRLLDSPEIIDVAIGNPNDKTDISHAETYNGKLSLRGLEDILFSGGGLTTLRDYCPHIDMTLFDTEHKRFNRDHPNFSLAKINALVQEFVQAVPETHKAFYRRVYDKNHLILGDYLFVHAGVDPTQPLSAQGIGVDAEPSDGKTHLERTMIRNPFLWRDNLPNCPYIVVHGHTPSVIESSTGVIADGQKDYRLCIDTDIFSARGALTCFVRGNEAEDGYFLAVRKQEPDHTVMYGIAPLGQYRAALQHMAKCPQYHSGRIGL